MILIQEVLIINYVLSATCVTTVEKLVQRDNGGEDLMTNLSQIKRDRMKGFLEMLKQTNNSDDQIKALNEIENFLDEKRYGLVWEEHEEEVDVKMRDNIPVFTEDESKVLLLTDREAIYRRSFSASYFVYDIVNLGSSASSKSSVSSSACSNTITGVSNISEYFSICSSVSEQLFHSPYSFI